MGASHDFRRRTARERIDECNFWTHPGRASAEEVVRRVRGGLPVKQLEFFTFEKL